MRSVPGSASLRARFTTSGFSSRRSDFRGSIAHSYHVRTIETSKSDGFGTSRSTGGQISAENKRKFLYASPRQKEAGYHNPGVGGSSPSPATNQINNLVPF